MNTARKVIGAQAFFFPEAKAFTLPAAGNASVTAKPDGDDAGWLNCGVSDWTFSPQNKISDFKGPAPGARVLLDKVTTERGLKLKGKWMQLSNLIYRMLLAGNVQLTGVGGQYTPLGEDPVIRGWLQLQQYDGRNTLINAMDVWVAMAIPGDVEFGDKEVDVNVEADVCFSSLNSGSLS